MCSSCLYNTSTDVQSVSLTVLSDLFPTNSNKFLRMNPNQATPVLSYLLMIEPSLFPQSSVLTIPFSSHGGSFKLANQLWPMTNQHISNRRNAIPSRHLQPQSWFKFSFSYSVWCRMSTDPELYTNWWGANSMSLRLRWYPSPPLLSILVSIHQYQFAISAEETRLAHNPPTLHYLTATILWL